jgi:hypothetical protein
MCGDGSVRHSRHGTRTTGAGLPVCSPDGTNMVCVGHADHLVPDDAHPSVDIFVAEAQGMGSFSQHYA